MAPRTYENQRIRVTFDAARCIHSGMCLRGSPTVFDTNAKPWINVDGAEAAAIAATIRECPSGALRYESDIVDAEVADDPTTIEVRPNGPLFVRGNVTLTRPGGESTEELRAALCRCGASENKPFCDNSHRKVGFRA